MKSSFGARLWTLFLTAVVGATLAAPAFSQTYVRGGVLLDWGESTRFRDVDCTSKMPVALYGCGAGNDGAPLRSLGDFDFGFPAGLEFGAGYSVVPYLRLEAGIQYRPDFSFEGRANFKGGPLDDPSERQDVSAELSAWSGLVAAYLDLSELLLFPYAPVGPFLGVGGGLSRIEIGETRMDFPKTWTVVPGGHHLSFSWMVTAGAAVSISPRLMLDVGWRYMDHGRIETARGEGRVFWRDGSREPLPLDLIETRGRLRSHGLNVSLRYAF